MAEMTKPMKSGWILFNKCNLLEFSEYSCMAITDTERLDTKAVIYNIRLWVTMPIKSDFAEEHTL